MIRKKKFINPSNHLKKKRFLKKKQKKNLKKVKRKKKNHFQKRKRKNFHIKGVFGLCFQTTIFSF